MQTKVLEKSRTNNVSQWNINPEPRQKTCLPLFLHQNDFVGTNFEENLISLATVDQYAFFGRTCGFQYLDSFKFPITSLLCIFASFNDGYESYHSSDISSSSSERSYIFSSNKSFSNLDQPRDSISSSKSTKTIVGQASKTMICGTKYLLNPELRAKKISKLIMNADIDFCKEFWRLPQIPVANKMIKAGSKLVTPAIGVNIVKSISLAKSLYLPKLEIKSNKQNNELVEIKPPIGSDLNDSVNIRILSYERLKGMVSEFKFN
jgi:hypothetical protein